MVSFFDIMCYFFGGEAPPMKSWSKFTAGDDSLNTLPAGSLLSFSSQIRDILRMKY